MTDKPWKLAPSRQIKDQLGSWYLLVLNIREGRMFNGLPPGSGDASDPADAIVLVSKSEDQMNQEQRYEMVFEIFQSPESELVYGPGQNNLVEVPPIAFPGDIVLAKGQVYKLFTDPVIYACKRDNLVAVIRESSYEYDRNAFFTKENGRAEYKVDLDALKETHGGNPQPVVDVGQHSAPKAPKKPKLILE